jgi:Toprim-like
MSKAILAADKLDDFLAELGCNLQNARKERVYRGRCPVHGGDGNNFCVITDGDTVPISWACFSHHCEKTYKSSLLGLVRGALTLQKGKKVSIVEAMNCIRRFVSTLPKSVPALPRPKTPAPTRPVAVWSHEQVRKRLIIPAPYFVSRGFDPAVLTKMDVGHSRSLMRSVVPCYDDRQMCVGFVSRWEGPACPRCGKYHPEDWPCGVWDAKKWRVMDGFQKSKHLYNFNDVRGTSSPFIVLVEGAGDVWKSIEADVPAVSCFGNDLSLDQAEKLALLGKRILVAFDRDEVGQAAAPWAVERLRSKGVQADQLLVPEPYHDVAEMPACVLSEWVRQATGVCG